MEQKEKYDRERDPEVIANRHKLFKQYIEPNIIFVDYLCARYILNKNWDTFAEIRDLCLINLYRYIETYDPSKYTGGKPGKNLQNWIHIVCKRFIHNYEQDLWNHENTHKDDVDISEIDDIFEDSLNSCNYVTLNNLQYELSDDTYAAFQKLTPLQAESLLMQHQGMRIADIHRVQQNKGRVSKTAGCDAVKKKMQKGREVIRQTIYERRKIRTEGRTTDEDMRVHNPKDEFMLEVLNPQKRGDENTVS